ncbi:phosphotransferase family protein [Xylanimonas protaetiae]|uniref:Aminoglycoside phosphotransferase family protein n=1 Tax=Xylanimonas protaetiae TaxID=2509457 RepID=A0A4P6F6J4_9MICO|nr:phosphotransferase [Xylanimonas protaetiae]QAY71264.1 aminoglycoside phosphotransferase family protein [Xylanimonas protaetiae]
MSSTETPPARRRPTWPQLPAPVRAAVEERLGERVTRWTSHDGGYSAGLASVLETASGDRVFVKAVDSGNDFTQHLYREEARRVALLPDGVPTPAFRWSATLDVVAGDPWQVLAFDAGEGRSPRVPWDVDELGAVVELASRIGACEVPVGALPEAADELPQGRWEELAARTHPGLDTFDPWVAKNLDRLAGLASGAADAVRGPGLVHGDLRGDNALVDHRAGRATAVAVDWPNAARGAAYVNVVGMLPAVVLEGGPAPEGVLAAHPLPPGTDDEAVTAFLALETGYFLSSSLRPPPPGIPHVRAFQRAQGEVCVAWLRRRLGE